MRRLRIYRERDLLDIAFTQLKNEYECRVVRDELASARRETALRSDEHNHLVREQINLLGFLSVPDLPIIMNVLVRMVRAETPKIKRRKRAHPTSQLNLVCIFLAVQYTKGTNVFRQ